ncbi:TenA family protein [Luedemannella helvata]|uniref:Thiaminase II n=1 Tax=Luedemannella helvata TaxID=349315 RepID=A0ABP4WUB8_9ACTN
MKSVAGQLWRDNGDLAAVALGHPFVRALADGTLPRQRYAAYIAQDAVFLESFARAYALALAGSPDRAGVEAFADLIAGVREELRLHESVAARWGIDMSAVQPAPATLAYTEFLLATASVGGTAATCAAMTPCMRLYAHLGRSLAAGPAADTYQEWISAYADPGFEALARSLEDLLDRYAPNVNAVAPAYRRAMSLEVAFFDAAY